MDHHHTDMGMPSEKGEVPMTVMLVSDGHNEDEATTSQTKQQKLIKLGLLVSLALVILYVVLDYTVSVFSCGFGALPSTRALVCVAYMTPLSGHSTAHR